MPYAQNTPIYQSGQHLCDWYSIHPHDPVTVQALSTSVVTVIPQPVTNCPANESGIHRPDLTRSKPVKVTPWRGWLPGVMAQGFIAAFIK